MAFARLDLNQRLSLTPDMADLLQEETRGLVFIGDFCFSPGRFADWMVARDISDDVPEGLDRHFRSTRHHARENVVEIAGSRAHRHEIAPSDSTKTPYKRLPVTIRHGRRRCDVHDFFQGPDPPVKLGEGGLALARRREGDALHALEVGDDAGRVHLGRLGRR